MIPVLFVSDNSNYLHNSDFDCFTIHRNAMTCDIKSAAIYHPPCRLFSKLKTVSKAGMCEKFYGYYSMFSVRKYGGILEHPAGSDLFKEMSCNMDGSRDQWGGYIRSVNLNWFGYPAEKKTYLYIKGIDPKDLPPIPLSFDAITHCIDANRSKNRTKKYLPKRQREITPIAMIEYFKETINLINAKHE